jgi:hypothetical protein
MTPEASKSNNHSLICGKQDSQTHNPGGVEKSDVELFNETYIKQNNL